MRAAACICHSCRCHSSLCVGAQDAKLHGYARVIWSTSVVRGDAGGTVPAARLNHASVCTSLAHGGRTDAADCPGRGLPICCACCCYRGAAMDPGEAPAVGRFLWQQCRQCHASSARSCSTHSTAGPSLTAHPALQLPGQPPVLDLGALAQCVGGGATPWGPELLQPLLRAVASALRVTPSAAGPFLNIASTAVAASPCSEAVRC